MTMTSTSGIAINQSVATAFAAVAAARAHEVALCFEGQRLTYAEVERQSRRLSAGLAALGVKAGDRVVIVARNRMEHVFWLLGAARIGALHTAVHPDWTAEELRRVVLDAAPAMVAVDGVLMVSARHAVQGSTVREVLDLDDAAAMAKFLSHGEIDSDAGRPDADMALWYTSGTSGRPKGVLWTHSAFLFNSLAIPQAVGIGPGDVGLRVSPLAHNGIAGAVIGTMLLGAPVHVMSRWNTSQVIDIIQKEGVTWTNLTPAAGRLVLDTALARGVTTLPSLRRLLVGAAPTPPDLLARLTRFLPRCAVVHGYGATEGYMAVCRPTETSRTDGSVGEALPDSEVRIADEKGVDVAPGTVGRILLRSPGVMHGYWRNPVATSQALSKDDWLDVGDLGRMDKHGSIWVLGRAFDVINCGGYNVYATEVEAALDRLPGVHASAVVGEPHDLLGECVVAYVEPDQGIKLDVEQLQEQCAVHLAKYKRPARITVVDALTRNGYGKIVKKDLQAGARPVPVAEPVSAVLQPHRSD